MPENYPPPNPFAVSTSHRCMPPPYGCGQVKDLREFPYLPNDHRCMSCKAEETRRSKQVEYEKRVTLAAQQIIAATAGNRIDVPHISQMVAEMYRWKGGLARFCESWWKMIDDPEQTSRKEALAAYKTVALLTVESSKQRDTAPDVVDMTDEELVGDIVRLLRTKGLKVVPAEDQPLIEAIKQHAETFEVENCSAPLVEPVVVEKHAEEAA